MPVFNCEKYIECCINSIISQTYSKLEVILIDDGSTDKSGMICDEYAKKYGNVSAIHQENGGITRARLTGVEHSKGEWITFVDADDWVEKDYYECLCSGGVDCDVIISGIYRYFNPIRCVEEKAYYQEGIYNKENIIGQIIPNMLWNPELGIWSLDASLCTKIFKREKVLTELKKAVKIRCDYGEDSIILFPLIFKINKLKVVKESFYYHRQREADKEPYYIQDKLFFEKLYQIYLYLKEEFVKAGYWDVMQNQLNHFYINAVKLKERYSMNIKYGFFALFPFTDVKRGAKVIIYGAGKVGEQYIRQNQEYNFCEIVAWVDMNYKNVIRKEIEVEEPEIIRRKEFDYVIIAISNYDKAVEIKQYLSTMNVPKEKIVWQSVRRCINEI